MPGVRKVGGAEVAIRDYGRYRPGETYAVDRETAEYLTSRSDFIVVKGDDGSGESDAEAEDTAGDDGTSEDAEVKALTELSHDELKSLAEDRGVADEIDLRSKESIIDALED